MIQRFSSSLAALALGALSLLPPSGLILCIGHDGHLAFALEASGVAFAVAEETSHCPCSGATSSTEPATVRRDSEPAHAPCDDVSLEGPAASALPRDGEAARSAGLSSDSPGEGTATGSLAFSLDLARDEDPSHSLLLRAPPPVSRHSLAIAPAQTSRRLV